MSRANPPLTASLQARWSPPFSLVTQASVTEHDRRRTATRRMNEDSRLTTSLRRDAR
jgi:hypothetical protein